MNFISAKTNYGLIAVMELVEGYGKNLVQIKDIVQRRGVPKNYLEQILNRLLKSGIVKSVRGNRGGYELNRNPDTLTLLDVIEALEGEIKLTNNIEMAALKGVFGKVETSVRNTLSITLSELWMQQKALDQQVLYHI
ncbi:Rrf2 family transcriptional regulator [Chitinispirillales bacterium ANBcel5]|uniref:RrF2 family transcriptional regulator n=1 Tax=Cellulosispirillum alkaliphilum TaxID=3039283 RepID=UPI002A52519D|nr:Rrf2 family transcriptional regulator [Chitinispirillales bacterium ANBcel5]